MLHTIQSDILTLLRMNTSHLVVISLGVVLDAIVVGQLHHKVAVLAPISHHRLAPLTVIRSTYIVHGRHLGGGR